MDGSNQDRRVILSRTKAGGREKPRLRIQDSMGANQIMNHPETSKPELNLQDRARSPETGEVIIISATAARGIL